MRRSFSLSGVSFAFFFNFGLFRLHIVCSWPDEFVILLSLSLLLESQNLVFKFTFSFIFRYLNNYLSFLHYRTPKCSICSRKELFPQLSKWLHVEHTTHDNVTFFHWIFKYSLLSQFFQFWLFNEWLNASFISAFNCFTVLGPWQGILNASVPWGISNRSSILLGFFVFFDTIFAFILLSDRQN